MDTPMEDENDNAREIFIDNATENIKVTCAKLDIPLSIQCLAADNCRMLYKELASTELPQAKDYRWNVCIIYAAAIDARYPYGPADPASSSLDNMYLTVTDLLQVTDIRVSEFFQRMKELKKYWPISEAVLRHLLLVERKFLISCPLFIKFENTVLSHSVMRVRTTKTSDEVIDHQLFHTLSRMFAEIFLVEDNVTNASRKTFCWKLFVFSRASIRQGGSQELVMSFHLLICCIEYIVRLTPSFQLNSPYDGVRCMVDSSSASDDILNELCNRFQGNPDEVKLIRKNCFEPVIRELPQAGNIIDVERLVADYEALYRAAGDINELDFLVAPTYLAVQVNREQNNNENGNATTPSSDNQGFLTPIRMAMNPVKQLARLLQETTNRPSAILMHYFNRCSINPWEMIERLLLSLDASFVRAYVEEMGERHETIARQRFVMSRQLYFRLIESLLRMEEERVKNCDFTRLLAKPIFHQCLLGCCAEVVMFTFDARVHSNIQTPMSEDSNAVGPRGLLFPWILEVFGMKAFDFFKVLESFIKAETRLAAEAVRHLRQIERQILEYRAWTSDSPLYDLMPQYTTVDQRSAVVPTVTANESLASCDSLSVKSDSSSSSSDIAMVPSGLSPVSDKVPYLPTETDGNVSALMESPSFSPRISHSVNHFLNRVLKLAYQTSENLCSMLGLTADLRHKIWTCLEYCITRKYILLRNRHLDQIIMCCVYAMCRVVDKEIKFKTIVAMYKDIPATSQQVYRRVRCMDNEYDSIIGFYNKVFMQALKSYVMKFSSNNAPPLSPLPRQPSTPSSHMSPVYMLPGRQNFRVSPMKKSPFQQPTSPSQMTPRSQQLYSFGDGPLSSEKLRQINKRMNAAGVQLPQPTRICRPAQKCMKFDSAMDVSDARTDLHIRRTAPPSRKSLTFDGEQTE